MINLLRMVTVLNIEVLQNVRVRIIVPTQEPVFLAPEPPLAEGERSDEATLWIDLNLDVISMLHVLLQELGFLSQEPLYFIFRLYSGYFLSGLRICVVFFVGVNVLPIFWVIIEKLNQIRYF